ncbi:MAG TPA: hypothetical protein VFD27_22655 [Chthoniobacteraceae bacterium]|nr:hypothetical protein [Chthoniobacteraceae bacterium]
MDFDTITDVSIWAIFALGLSLPAWLVFYPPRIIRSWPSFLRLLIAILCTHAAIYALFYCCIYPVVRAYAGAHPGYLLDGILLVPPNTGWRIGVVVAPVFFAIRFCLVAYRRRSNHDASLPTSGST